jgi:putative ABC transport system substrate-binding protein
MMRRRDFIALLGGGAAWPLAARAQQPTMPVIGYLNSGSSQPSDVYLAAFRRSLSETGYVEGRNVAIEYRWADGENARLQAMAIDLVGRQVSVLVVDGPSARPAKVATTAIPIVFAIGGDPVQLGLVASLNRPGGNLTGITNLGVEIGPKRLELLKEVVPGATITALLINPTNPNAETQLRDLQAAARILGMQPHVLYASNEHELDSAFATLIELQVGRLAIVGDGFFNSRSEQLAGLALRSAVPTIYQYREFAAAGGLMSYGTDNAEQWRQVGVYTGRILKGEKPADLPVQQVTKVELIINLRTAKALGITMPLALLTRADEVIE